MNTTDPSTLQPVTDWVQRTFDNGAKGEGAALQLAERYRLKTLEQDAEIAMLRRQLATLEAVLNNLAVEDVK